MSKIIEFIKECECFFVITLNGAYPAARPFGAIMERGDKLYIATHDGNEAHAQLRADGHVQIVAKKTASREWVRVTGFAEECADTELKRRFMEECPVLKRHYESAESDRFLIFAVSVKNVEFH